MRSGLLGQRMDVLLQLRQGHPRFDRCAVTHDVKVVVAEVHDAPPVRIVDVSLADVPFLRNRPIEDASARRDLVHVERDPLADAMKRLADPVSGDAAAKGEQLRHEVGHLGADLLGVEIRFQVAHVVLTDRRGHRQDRPCLSVTKEPDSWHESSCPKRVPESGSDRGVWVGGVGDSRRLAVDTDLTGLEQ